MVYSIIPEKMRTSLPGAGYLSIAPGRVNLLGEHVDYNGGAVLPVAIDRTVKIAARERDDGKIGLSALDLGERIVLDVSGLDQKRDLSGHALPPWALYPAGVASVFQEHGLTVKGIDAVYTSDIPIGAGLSSSAAVEVAFAVLWQEIGGWSLDRLALAKLCQEAENHYVGLNCGLMDQFASANGIEGHVMVFDTKSLESETVPLPQGVALVIADSGVRHTLASSAYNERRASCDEALSIIKSLLPGVETLADIHPDEFRPLAERLPEIPRKRAGFVVSECARVRQAVGLLNQGKAADFGKLMIATHAGLRDDYEVSCAELDCLVDTACSLSGCLGARLTGAGFGGCTVNLVEETNAEAFMVGLREGYRKKMGKEANIFRCKASQGAQVFRLEK